ncbi:MAG: glycosyl hydrolase family 2 [Bacteroidales bacterium]|jgi:hypothetical protein|nr:glycosyl hydrolase family 2 [Bacteroidales bacterium]
MVLKIKKLTSIFPAWAFLFFSVSCGTRQYEPDKDSAEIRILSLQPFADSSGVRWECRIATAVDIPATAMTVEIFHAQTGDLLWEGSLSGKNITKGDHLPITGHVQGLHPELWSPVSPHLYYMRARVSDAQKTVRFGFRSFTMKDGQFYLNGNRIFLRGNAINPPGRGIPGKVEESRQFAQDYVRFLKSIHINILRIPDSQVWADVCDEEGMMLYGGKYGRPTTATSDHPPVDFEKAMEAYKESDLGPFVRHPSMMIYTLSNEMPYEGKIGEQYAEFLSQAYSMLKEWDPNRLYIGNAGYGLGKCGDIYDVHRYWGWYYNTFLTYMNMRDEKMWQNEGKAQPVTFTECVGNYTGVDGRYNLCSRTKQPGAQKCWTGHAPDSLQGQLALEYQSFVLKNATEFFRRFRSQNPKLAGIMPFTILFFHWNGIESFEQMEAKPVAEQFRISYQPLLPSIELWKTQIYAGTALVFNLHVVNDDDHYMPLLDGKIHYSLETQAGKLLLEGKIEIPPIAYYQTAKFPIRLQIPDNIATGHYRLKVGLFSNNRPTARNETGLFIADKTTWKKVIQPRRKLYLYDRIGKTGALLSACRVDYSDLPAVEEASPSSAIIIGEDSWDKTLSQQKKQIARFVRNGGRVLCLKQHHDTFDTQWLPKQTVMYRYSANDAMFPDGADGKKSYLSPALAYRDGMNINPERADHRIFAGISRNMLQLWSDGSGYDESKPGFPQIYPVTQGFEIKSSDMKEVAILANYGRALSGVALCEYFSGNGSILLSGFDLVDHCGLDPAADRLWTNMINYLSSDDKHELYPLMDRPIIWGDFASERGLVTGYYNGLLLHTFPLVPESGAGRLPLKTDELGFQTAGGVGGWNSRPGIQYVAGGRRPFAPFSYTRGGNTFVEKSNTAFGEGHFFIRIPPGKKRMLTEAENPKNDPIRLSVGINDEKRKDNMLAGNTVVLLSTPLPESDVLKITYSGDRSVILKKTWFE